MINIQGMQSTFINVTISEQQLIDEMVKLIERKSCLPVGAYLNADTDCIWVEDSDSRCPDKFLRKATIEDIDAFRLVSGVRNVLHMPYEVEAI